MKKVKLDKAFYWKCVYCGGRIREGDVVFIQEGFMSGNTPVFHKSHPYHLKCYILKHGEEECYFLSTSQ
jgi:hypothetical protein